MPFPLPFSILLSMPFLISILVCVFLSPAPYCFSCSPHLAQPLFLCPLLHRDNGLLTAFQLPQGLRGLDGCRMLMSEPQHWTSAAHTAEGGGAGIWDYVKVTTTNKMRSLKGHLFQWLKSASSAHSPIQRHIPAVKLWTQLDLRCSL